MLRYYLVEAVSLLYDSLQDIPDRASINKQIIKFLKIVTDESFIHRKLDAMYGGQSET